MIFKNLGIQKKLMSIILLTCSTALVVMGSAYILYEYFSFQTAEKNKVSTLALVIASNSSAALAFDSQSDATEILSALRADKFIVAACLYKVDGSILAKYPEDISDKRLPRQSPKAGYYFHGNHLEGFVPVKQNNMFLGTLYIKSSMSGLYSKMRFNILIALSLIIGTLIIAYLISNLLQRSISKPIISLERVAKQISENGDYSVRAKKSGNDELGSLTNAFNQMLNRIEQQNNEIILVNQESSKLAAIVESSGDAIIGNTLDFLISTWNHAAEKMLGYTQKEMIGKSVEKLVSPHRVNHMMNMLEELKTGIEKVATFEIQFISKEQQLLDISLTISPVKDASGLIIGMSQIARDISSEKAKERKIAENEEHLRLATQSAELGTFDLDLIKGNMLWDKRCRELFGIYDDRPISYDEHFVKGLHENDREGILQVINNAFIKQVSNGHFDVEYRTVGEDGKLRWVRAKGKVFFNDDDKPVRFIGSVLETTDKKLEEQRKNDFIAIISHELKTPLTTIKSYVQLMLAKAKKEDDNFGINALSRANAQTNKMSSMIKDFLSLARIEEGKIKLIKEVFSLHELMEEVSAETNLLSRGYNIFLEACAGIMVNADRDKIGQVLINLLSNAIKYSPTESTITMGCETSGNKVKVFVKDEGIGISLKDQEKLFTRFYRVQHEKARTVSGFGIGLYIVAEILKYHNSEIMVESQEDKGSIFYFWLDMMPDK